MRIILLILIFFGIISMSKAQDNNIDTSHQFTVVHLPDYYKEQGVIFAKDYLVGIEMRNLQSRYTPTRDDIINAEKIFNDKYNEIQKANVDTKTFFCHWVRQYVGLIDINGNKNIVVQLVNNTKPRKINRLLGKNWETAFVIMLSDDFYRVSARFRVNIDTAEISDKL
jgi:hypothetical protein